MTPEQRRKRAMRKRINNARRASSAMKRTRRTREVPQKTDNMDGNFLVDQETATGASLGPEAGGPTSEGNKLADYLDDIQERARWMLKSKDKKASKEYIATSLRKQLKELLIAADEGLYFALVAIYTVGMIVRSRKPKGKRDEMLTRLGIGDNTKRVFLALLNRYGLPKKGSAMRKTVQSRYSNYSNALEEAAKQNIQPKDLLGNFRSDGGIERLADRFRDRKRKAKPEPAGAESASFVEGNDENQKGASGGVMPERQASLTSRKSMRAVKRSDSLDDDQDSFWFSPNFDVAEAARGSVGKGIGRYVGIFYLEQPAGPTRVTLSLTDALPHHRFGDDDQAALDAMIDSVRTSSKKEKKGKRAEADEDWGS